MTLAWPVRLVTLAAIWGLSFLFVKVGDERLAPFQVALGRTALGALVLLAILLAGRRRLPRGRRVWMHLAIVGLLFNAAPFSLFAFGEQHISSLLAGIWNATTPLMTAPFAFVALAAERPTARRLTGLGIGFCGVLVVLGVWAGIGHQDLVGDLCCLGAALCYGTAFTWTRRFLAGRSEGPVPLMAGQLLAASAELVVVTVLTTSVPPGLPLRVVGSVVALGAVGTGLAYLMNYSIIRDAGATAASTVTYLVPVFSIAAGVVVLGERLTWNEPVGAAIIVVGAAAAQSPVRRSPTAAGGARGAGHEVAQDGAGAAARP